MQLLGSPLIADIGGGGTDLLTAALVLLFAAFMAAKALALIESRRLPAARWMGAKHVILTYA